MPPSPQWLPKGELLTYEEIHRVARVLAAMGVRAIRLSGGEPLLRRNLPSLVQMLSRIPGIETLAVTTNGYFLSEQAQDLRAAGLTGVTVSLHSLRRERFEAIVGTKGVFEKTMEGLLKALEVGFESVKINVVITRSCNDDEIVDFASLARDLAVTVRFIEYMPFDGQKVWDPKRMVSGQEIVETISSVFPLVALARRPGATALTFSFADGAPGGIGIIASMTLPFCSDCDRIRLTADGKIVPCLFSKDQYDLKALLRRGADDQEIEDFIRKVFFKKFEGVESLLRHAAAPSHIRPMHTIGG